MKSSDTSAPKLMAVERAGAPTHAKGVAASSGGKYRREAEARLRNLMSNPIGSILLLLVAFLILFFPFVDEFFDWKRLADAIPILMFVLLALGLNIVVGFAGLLDLGYAAFFAIGAYTAAILTSRESPINNGAVNWYSNFWIAIVVAFFVAIVSGILLGAPTLRLRGDYLAIVTLGFGEIIPRIFRLASGITKGEAGLGGTAKPLIDVGWINFKFEIGSDPLLGLKDYSPRISWYYLLILIGFLCIVGLRRLQDSRIGRAWMAIREDEIAASAMGINLVTTKLSAFGMGASLSGLVGAVYGSYVGLVHPSAFEFSTSIILLCMVILGGLGNIWGVILGGIIIQVFDRIMAGEITKFLNGIGRNTGNDYLATMELSDFRYFIFGAALVILMLVRPEGLFPSQRRKAELHPEQDSLQGESQGEGPGYSGPSVEPTPESQQQRETLYGTREKDNSTQEQR